MINFPYLPLNVPGQLKIQTYFSISAFSVSQYFIANFMPLVGKTGFVKLTCIQHTKAHSPCSRCLACFQRIYVSF